MGSVLEQYLLIAVLTVGSLSAGLADVGQQSSPCYKGRGKPCNFGVAPYLFRAASACEVKMGVSGGLD